MPRYLFQIKYQDRDTDKHLSIDRMKNINDVPDASRQIYRGGNEVMYATVVATNTREALNAFWQMYDEFMMGRR